MKYDFSDEAIRIMVFTTHVPIETSVGVRGYAIREGIICRQCKGDWPCDAIQALRRYQARHPSDKELPQ